LVGLLAGIAVSVLFLVLFLLTILVVRLIWPGYGARSAEAASWLSIVWIIPMVGLLGWVWAKSNLSASWGCTGLLIGCILSAAVAVGLSLAFGI
jgi:hypothetical protein